MASTAQGAKFKIPLPRSFVPGPTDPQHIRAIDVGPAAPESLGFENVDTYHTDGRTSDRFYKSSRLSGDRQ